MAREVAGHNGRYVVENEIGSGAVGIVYRARRLPRGEPVAIKILRTPFPDDDTRRRFEQEARLGESLRHEALVRVLDHGNHEGRDFLVMDLVEGTGLDALLHRGAVPLEQGVALVAQLARGLQAAHELGIVHRDVKPANILVDSRGRPFLTDFGFAKDLTSALKLTRDASVVGTPVYMAPEQAQGLPVTHRVDVYALGVVLYQIATGDVPFHGSDADATLAMVASAPVPSPRRLAPDLPARLEAVILRCLSKEPDDRFETAAELALALEGDSTGSARVDTADSNRTLRLVALSLTIAGGLSVTIALGLVAGRAWAPGGHPHDAETPAPTASPADVRAHPGAAALNLALDLARKGESPRLVRAELDRCLELEPACARAHLEIALLDIERGDLDSARAALRRADETHPAEAEDRALRDTASRKIADEAEAQDGVLTRAAQAVREFKPRVALSALEPAAAAHPDSARIQQALALALALDGRGGDALAHAALARKLDASLGEIFDTEERRQLEVCAEQPSLEPREGWTTPPDLWQPLFGGSWLAREGELLGRGLGAGAFDFAGLMRTDAPAAEHYRVRVDVELVSGRPGAYAGILFGARSPGDVYLIYMIHDRELIEHAIPPADLERIQLEKGAFPKVIRVARLVNDKWQMRQEDNFLISFPDTGFSTLTIEVTKPGSFTFEIGSTRHEVALDRPADGRVGLIKFYDTVVRFRNWELTRLD